MEHGNVIEQGTKLEGQQIVPFNKYKLHIQLHGKQIGLINEHYGLNCLIILRKLRNLEKSLALHNP